MSEPLTLASTTARHALPMIFPGQVQKEYAINEAHALIDALMHPAVGGTIGEPPEEGQDGDCWIVAPDAAGAWAGKAAMIATRQASAWLFARPCDGMRVFDRSSGRELLYRENSWQEPATVNRPEGGATVDSEARAAVAALIAALQARGLLGSPDQAA